MLSFESLPPIPDDYAWFSVLDERARELMRRAAYVRAANEPANSLPRTGIELGPSHPCLQDPDGLCSRIFVVWFCFLYEQFMTLEAPLAALEELILEFGAPSVLDTADCALGQAYAGAAGAEPITAEERARHHEWLAPHYTKALGLLGRQRDS